MCLLETKLLQVWLLVMSFIFSPQFSVVLTWGAPQGAVTCFKASKQHLFPLHGIVPAFFWLTC